MLVLATSLLPGCSADPPPPRPNIVLIVADDLGWADAGFRGGAGPTPVLNRLAAAGIVLDRFYASPICTPTRTQLMSGKSAMRFDLIGNLVPDEIGGLPPTEMLLPEWLAESGGYRTALIGKWHLGTRPGFRPHERGFERAYGNLEGWVDHYTHERNGVLDWQRNGEPVLEKGYAADLIAGEAVSWLHGVGRDEPFFLYLPFTAPHTPLQAPPELVAATPPAPSPQRRTYLAMVAALDRAVGRVVEEVDRRGQLQHTLFLFMSDNGGAIHFGGSNQPLRAGKRTVYEGGIRVPALISWPARLPQGVTSQQLMTSLDVMPTLLEAAGIAVPQPLDGESLLRPLADGSIVPRPTQYFAAEGPAKLHLGVLEFPWKLVAVIDRQAGTSEMQLFDVVVDPVEHRNLAAERTDLVHSMTERLEAWWALNPRDSRLPLAASPENSSREVAGPERR